MCQVEVGLTQVLDACLSERCLTWHKTCAIITYIGGSMDREEADILTPVMTEINKARNKINEWRALPLYNQGEHNA